MTQTTTSTLLITHTDTRAHTHTHRHTRIHTYIRLPPAASYTVSHALFQVAVVSRPQSHTPSYSPAWFNHSHPALQTTSPTTSSPVFLKRHRSHRHTDTHRHSHTHRHTQTPTDTHRHTHTHTCLLFYLTQTLSLTLKHVPDRWHLSSSTLLFDPVPPHSLQLSHSSRCPRPQTTSHPHPHLVPDVHLRRVGHPFETPLLIQCFVMIVSCLVLQHACVTYDRDHLMYRSNIHFNCECTGRGVRRAAMKCNNRRG